MSTSSTSQNKTNRCFALLAASIVLGFTLQLLLGANLQKVDTASLVIAGAAYTPLVAAGDWWRLFSSLFIHVGILPLFINLCCLISVGSMAETIFGKARLLVIYFLAGAAGNLLCMFAFPFAALAGASGAISGLFGAVVGAKWSEPLKVPPLKWAPITLVFFAVMNLLAIREISNIVLNIGGFFAGLLLAHFTYAASLERPDRAIAKQERFFAVLSIVLLFLSIIELPKVPNVFEALHGTRALSYQTALKSSEMSFSADAEDKKIEFIQHELLDPWLKQEAKLSELKSNLGAWMDKPALGKDVNEAYDRATASIASYQALLLFSKQRRHLSHVAEVDYISVVSSTILPELKQTLADLQVNKTATYDPSTNKLIQFTKEQGNIWQKTLLSSYVSSITKSQNEVNAQDADRFAKIFDLSHVDEKKVSAALSFANKNMMESCGVAKKYHADLERLDAESSSALMDLVVACELNQVFARATALDQIARFRFSYLVDRLLANKIAKDQAVAFSQKLIAPVLAEDFLGESARTPSSEADKFELDYEKIKKLQLGRKDALHLLDQAIRSGNAGELSHASMLWKSLDRGVGEEVRQKILQPSDGEKARSPASTGQ